MLTISPSTIRILPIGELTPIDVFERIALRSPSFLLESAKGPPRTSRYSFIGTDPFLIFISKNGTNTIRSRKKSRIVTGDPFLLLRELFSQLYLPPDASLPPFWGGAVGFFGYGSAHFFERLPRHARDDLHLPDVFLIFVDTVIAFDHAEGTISIITTSREQDKEEGHKRISEIEKRLHLPAVPRPPHARGRCFSFSPHMRKEDYIAMVTRCKEYIAAGDIYQANLSQRFVCPVERDPFEIYKTLRQINPSPFSAYLNFDDITLVSSSPERLVRLTGRNLETRPIAGTRPRGHDPCEESRMRGELLTNEKERAEHLMLVDLERNDIGRVCEFGTVQVDEFMVTECYSHVIHIVSNIKGRLKEGKDCLDLIRAVFPGGTVTGVPKVRCMEIIDELEPVARGPYTGSIGYISFSGDMDLNIIIRTLLIKEKKAYAQVGAGIVADSDPEREYEETLHKAQALFDAVRLQC